MKYDYLIVGSGLFGAVFAHAAKNKNKKCLVLEKRSHIGGNIYTEKIEDIQVHRYGAHIFHTSMKNVWEYINQFTEFNSYVNSPLAVYKNEVYNLPFNMNTFYQMWGTIFPADAKRKIEEQIKNADIGKPANLEEQAIHLVGRDIYEKLIKGYTEKQWGRDCRELPAFIINRLPVRFRYDNNYFNDRYQGIPIGGYTAIIEKMLEDIDVKCGVDFFSDREYFMDCADKIIFTGPVDAYYDYCYGKLEYRSLDFATEILPLENYQGNAVINYTERDVPYTRVIEHKHFEFGKQPHTVITREYPATWSLGKEAYYTVNDDHNNSLYKKYKELAENEKQILFGGRLGCYCYYDMDKVIAAALQMVDAELYN